MGPSTLFTTLARQMSVTTAARVVCSCGGPGRGAGGGRIYTLRLTIVQRVNGVNHQLKESVAEVRSRVEDGNAGV
jgi:hypothetical protein